MPRELMRWPGEPSLRELAREGEQPVRGGDEIVASDRPPPRVGTRAPVGRYPPGDDEARLVFGTQVAERLEPVLLEESLRNVQLGLDVRLGPRCADGRGVALRPEQEADRWVKIVLPAPVSPVSATSPGASSRSASRMRTRFSIRSLRSTRGS